jgi:hypothetical protein
MRVVKKITHGDASGRIYEPQRHFVNLSKTLNSVRDEEGKPVTGGHDLEFISLLLRFMSNVIYGSALAFELRKMGQKDIAHALPLGREFRRLGLFSEMYADDLHYSPSLELFFRTYRRHPIRWWVVDGRVNGGADVKPIDRVRVCNHFISCMRRRAVRLNIKAKISDWERNANKNRDRLYRYIPALFEQSSRLVFIRLDLLYRKNLKPNAEVDRILDERPFRVSEEHDRYFNLLATPSGGLTVEDRGGHTKNPIYTTPRVGRPDIREVLRDRERLMRNMRSKPTLFSKLAGYIIRIEFTRDAGYHLHAAFIFKEALNHAYLGKKIGEYWEQVITEGRGYHFNSNLEKYRCYAVGPVEAHETEKREKLMEVLCYLAKRDQYVHVKPTQRAKMFTTGHFPKKRPKKLGRPRKRGVKFDKQAANGTRLVISEIVLGQARQGFTGNGENWNVAGMEKITGGEKW